MFRRKKKLELKFGYLNPLPDLLSEQILDLPWGFYKIVLTSIDNSTRRPLRHTIFGDDKVAILDQAKHIADFYGIGIIKIKVTPYNREEMISYSERELRKLGVVI